MNLQRSAHPFHQTKPAALTDRRPRAACDHCYADCTRITDTHGPNLVFTCPNGHHVTRDRLAAERHSIWIARYHAGSDSRNT